METLIIIRTIAEIIMFAALVYLAIILTIHIKRLSGSVNKVQGDITEITQKVGLLSTDISVTIIEVQKISETVNTEITKIKGFTDKAVETGQEVLQQTRNISGTISEYLGDSKNFISAVKNGFRVFKTKLVHN